MSFTTRGIDSLCCEGLALCWSKSAGQAVAASYVYHVFWFAD